MFITFEAVIVAGALPVWLPICCDNQRIAAHTISSAAPASGSSSADMRISRKTPLTACCCQQVFRNVTRRHRACSINNAMLALTADNDRTLSTGIHVTICHSAVDTQRSSLIILRCQRTAKFSAARASSPPATAKDLPAASRAQNTVSGLRVNQRGISQQAAIMRHRYSPHGQKQA